MKRFFFKSIRFQIILLYLIILATTLSIFSAFLYFDFSNILNGKLDAVLHLKASSIEESIRTFWKAGKMEMTKDWTDVHLFFKDMEEDRFKTIANHLTMAQLNQTDYMPTVTLIYSPDGELIAASDDIPALPDLHSRVLESAQSHEQRFDTVRLLTMGDEKPIFCRVFTKPIADKGKVKYVVQVLASLNPLYNELRGLKTAFFLRVPIVLLIAILAALLLVQVTLNPIDEMVSSIREIKPDNLNVRLKVPKTDDEVARLAQTFNEMLTEMERSFGAQRQIVHDIAHELRTPLTILQGQQEVALRRERTAGQYKELIYSNLEEIERMRHIINNLLLLASFDRKSVVMEMKPLNVNKMLEEILNNFKSTLKKRDITVELIENLRDRIKGDEVYLRIVFSNLLDNAIKYSPDSGKVTVRVSPFKEFAKIEISDNGQGIPASQLPYIFDRFYKVDKARSSGAGFGLSLSIAKSIVQVHHGKIEVQSQLSQGTTFTVFLPLA